MKKALVIFCLYVFSCFISSSAFACSYGYKIVENPSTKLSNYSGSEFVAISNRPHAFDIQILNDDCSIDTSVNGIPPTGTINLGFWVETVKNLYSFSNKSISNPIDSPSVSICLNANSNCQSSATVYYSVSDFVRSYQTTAIKPIFVNGVTTIFIKSYSSGRFTFNFADTTKLWFQSDQLFSITVTFRPLALILYDFTNTDGVKLSDMSTNNSSGLVWEKAGRTFSARLYSIWWQSTIDTNNDGILDSNIPLSMVSGQIDTSFSDSITLTPLPGSQNPASGVLGNLSATVALGSGGPLSGSSTSGYFNLSYDEVGSFVLKTKDVITDFHGVVGLNVDLVVFNSAGNQVANPVIGRFVPAGFVVQNPKYVMRSDLTCIPNSIFNYLGEPMNSTFTLVAVNKQLNVTKNYIDSYSKINLNNPASFFMTGAIPFHTASRLTQNSASGTFVNGSADVTFNFTPQRGASLENQANINFTINPKDSDNVALINANSGKLGSADFRFGFLRMFGSAGSELVDSSLLVQTQYYNGNKWVANPDDSCTSIKPTALNFKNYSKGMTAAYTNIAAPISIKNGSGRLTVAKPPFGVTGGADVAISLGPTTALSYCTPWTPAIGDAATAGANMSYLRGPNCGTGLNYDPAARVTFGVFRASDQIINMRESY